jgi:chromosome segregation ATPase
MATISDIRDGIATNLATITGLRTTETVPDNPQPPVAIIQPNSIEYDRAFQRGLDQYSFTVTVIVGRASERNAQRTLDTYCGGSGSSSVKTAKNYAKPAKPRNHIKITSEINKIEAKISGVQLKLSQLETSLADLTSANQSGMVRFEELSSMYASKQKELQELEEKWLLLNAELESAAHA